MPTRVRRRKSGHVENGTSREIVPQSPKAHKDPMRPFHVVTSFQYFVTLLVVILYVQLLTCKAAKC